MASSDQTTKASDQVTTTAPDQVAMASGQVTVSSDQVIAPSDQATMAADQVTTSSDQATAAPDEVIVSTEEVRLYIALYARGGTAKMIGGEDKYHWSLITGPEVENKESRGHRHHVKLAYGQVGNPPTEGMYWKYDKTNITMMPTSMILVRVLVGKIKSLSRLDAIIEKTSIRPKQASWNCVIWVKEALQAATQDGEALEGAGTDWATARDIAMRYAGEKIEAGRFTNFFDFVKVPTWDGIENEQLEA
ncbi:hypothetical protein ACHAPT_004190 [Fusarium lateritium]